MEFSAAGADAGRSGLTAGGPARHGTVQRAAMSLFLPDDPAENLQNLFPPLRVGSCAKDLAKQADLMQYSYRRFAEDLENVRRTLGYGPLNLFAGSYGTRAAQVFVRKYPGSVSVLDQSAKPIELSNDTLERGCDSGCAPSTSCEGRQASSSPLPPCIRCWALSNLLLEQAAFRGRDCEPFSESRMRELCLSGSMSGLCQEDEKTSCCTKDEGGPFEAVL